MIDSRDDITLRRKVLGQVSHECAGTWITMRNNDERERFALNRRGIAQRFPRDLEGLRHVRTIPRADHRADIDCVLGLTGRYSRGIPDLYFQRSIVERRLARLLIEVKDIYLTGMYEAKRPHTDSISPSRS
jgi:hypothetical protein